MNRGISGPGPGVIYQFEDVGDDLPRPPMSAMRGFLASGIVLSPKGWGGISIDQRRGFVVAGSAPSIDTVAIQSAVRNASVAEVRLVPRVLDPDPNNVPAGLVAALGPHARISNSKWAQLRPIDRYVLTTLALNTRLLFRALREIMPEDTATDNVAWKAAVAHVEVEMRPDTLDKLRNAGFLDGRAFVLARVAGVRAARRAQETFDLRSERATGTIELDWAPLDGPGAVVWQAHVSSWDGAFFAAAALAAASTAAVALADMVAEEDKSVSITSAKIAEEPWVVGSDQRDQPTTVFAGRDVRASIAAGARNTARMDNPGDTASRVNLPPGVRSNAPPQTGNAIDTAKHPAATANDPFRALAQNSVLLWALFGMLTVMLAALIGIILALVNMHR